jgi:hypothetical protein
MLDDGILEPDRGKRRIIELGGSGELVKVQRRRRWG